MKKQILKDIDAICSIYPTIKMYDEPRERLAGRIAHHIAKINIDLLVMCKTLLAILKHPTNHVTDLHCQQLEEVITAATGDDA